MSHQSCLALVISVTLLIDVAGSQPKLDLYGDPLPPGAVARLGTTRFRHVRRIIGLAYSHDGKRIIGLGENDNTPENQALRVWEADSGRVLRTIDAGYQYPRGFALAPKSELAATVGFYFDPLALKHVRNVKIIDTKTKQQRLAIKWEERHECFQVVWSPDEKALATASTDGTVRIWESATGKLLLKKKLAERRIDDLCYSPDGKTIAAASRGGVYLWNWSGKRPPKLIPTGQRGAIAVNYSVDGKWLAAGTDHDKGVYLIDVQQGKAVRTFKPPGGSYLYFPDVAFTPDGKYLAASDSFANQVLLWSIPSGDLVRTFDASPGRPANLAISSDSRRLAVTDDSAVRQWDLSSGREIHSFPQAHLEEGVQVAFCRDPKTIVSGGNDGTIRLWNVQTQQQKLLMRHDHPPGGFPWIRGMAYSPDGRWIASAGGDNTTRLWNAHTGAQVYKLPGHGRLGGRWRVAFSTDSKWFATWGDDMRLRVWEVRTGKALSEHRLRFDGGEPLDPAEDDEDLEDRDEPFGARFSFYAAGFSHNAARFFGHKDGAVHLFDSATGKKLNDFPFARVQSLAASTAGRTVLLATSGPPTETPLPDGRVRHSAAKNHTLVLIDSTTGRTIWDVKDIDGYPGQLAYSPDERLLAQAPRKSPPEIQLYSAAGEKLQTIRGFSGTVSSLAFSADGGLLAAGLSDTTVLVWKIGF